MSPSRALPAHELVVSNVALEGAALSLRLVTDYHPDAEPAALMVEVLGLAEPQASFAFLERCRIDCLGVYVSHRDAGLALETEAGETLELAASSVAWEPTNFNERELAEVLRRVNTWYLSEHKAGREAQARIQSARELLVEQSRRVEVKAGSHEPNGTAATLYSQQLAFLQRVLDALET
jgi:hypothetical protein